jgi:hypothetical protein
LRIRNLLVAEDVVRLVARDTEDTCCYAWTSSGNHAQTDWSAVDLAVRAKRLGMSVNVTLFYSGDNTAETMSGEVWIAFAKFLPLFEPSLRSQSR